MRPILNSLYYIPEWLPVFEEDLPLGVDPECPLGLRGGRRRGASSEVHRPPKVVVSPVDRLVASAHPRSPQAAEGEEEEEEEEREVSLQ